MKRKGLFITFEGPDGSGKSIQVQRLAQVLRGQGKRVVETREPGGSPIAEEIRQILVTGDKEKMDKITECLLFAAARSDHLRQTVWPAVQQGKIVISDRFMDSTYAYQGAGYQSNTTKRAELHAFINKLHWGLMKDFKPDLTILLDLPVQIGLARSKNRPGNNEQRFEDQEDRKSTRLNSSH